MAQTTSLLLAGTATSRGIVSNGHCPPKLIAHVCVGYWRQAVGLQRRRQRNLNPRQSCRVIDLTVCEDGAARVAGRGEASLSSPPQAKLL